MGYSWGIRGVFVEYSRGIHMYRLCIGYVSEHTRSWEGLIKTERGLHYSQKGFLRIETF